MKETSRKQTLVDYGFRLPSALDNRPLKFEEFEKKINQVVMFQQRLRNMNLQKPEQEQQKEKN